MNNPQIVITGLGTINSIAANISEYVQSLKSGRCGIKELTVFNPEGHMTGNAAEIENFSPGRYLGPGFSTKRMSRGDLLGMVAAVEALTDAGLFPPPVDLVDDIGVSLGGGAGGLLQAEEFYRLYLQRGGPNLPYSWLAPVYCASTADHLTARFGFHGPKTTFMTACSSGATALGNARDWLVRGMAKVVLAGGAEPLCRMTYTAFNALRAVDPEYCKPFDKNRAGLTLGEGAGFMVMETLEQARARGAKIYAEFLGYGLSGDAHHMTAPAPDGSGAARAMNTALQDAGLTPDRVDYINAHGTGTPANDVVETRAIKQVWGQRAYHVPVSSTKSMIGHTLGAAGALEAVACVLAINHGFIPPTIHHLEPDPECDLDYVSQGSRPAGLDIVLSNSFAFGGNNTSIVIGRFEEKGKTHV